MIDPRFAILGALVTLAGNVAYARDTVRGHTRPNRVSWAMWTVAPLIAFAAELVQRVGLDALQTFAVGFGPLLVLVASFVNPRAYARLTAADLVCGALSVAALVAWVVTGTGNLAILFGLLADFFGALPTVRKAWLDPASESAVAFAASALGAAITLLTISRWSFAAAAFPVYVTLAGSAIGALILLPRDRADPAATGQRPLGGACTSDHSARSGRGVVS